VIVVVDGPLRRHLVAALEGYREALRRNGIAPPPDLRRLVDALRVSGGQSGPRNADLDDSADAGSMQQLALTYRDSADRLGVSESTVKRLVRDGQLPAVDILGARRIRSKDLDAYLEELGSEQADETKRNRNR
jgi:excisionase family DNA binding protein